MQTASRLGNVSIVLVETKAPANIGAAARAMMNMGLSRLALVNPPADKNNDARKLASGADEILDNAKVFQSLKEAVSDKALIVGATRHAGRRRKNIGTPWEVMDKVVPLLERNKVSFVFGNEINGLELSDLALCNELVSIPSSETFPSLNLSHAVMVIAYELFVAAVETKGFSAGEPAPSEQLEGFYEHLERTLKGVEFMADRDSDRLMLSLRQVFGRSRLDPREVSILRGILTSVNRKCGLR